MTRRLLGLGALALVPVLVLGVFFVVPVAGMVALGFWPDGTFAPGAVLDVLTRDRTVRVLAFTLWSAAAGTVASVLLGLPAAYVLHRTAFPLRRFLRAALLVPFVLPTVVVGVAFRQLLGEGGPLGFLGLDGTPAAIVLGLVFFNVAVVIRVVGGAWESLDPRPGQAAATLGASPAQVFRTVTLPGAAAGGRLGRQRRLPVLRDRVRHRAHPRRQPLRHRRDRDLPAHRPGLRPVRRPPRCRSCSSWSSWCCCSLAGRARDHRAGRRGGPPARARSAAPTPYRVGRDAAPPAVRRRPDRRARRRLAAGRRRAGASSNYAALSTTGDRQALQVPVTDALANSLRTAVDATWMAIGTGLLVALRRDPPVPVARPSAGSAACSTGFFMLPLGVSAVTLGFGLPDHPRPAAARPARQPAAGAGRAGPGRAAAGRPHPGAGARRHRRPAAAGGRLARGRPAADAARPSTCPVLWKPLLAARRLRVRRVAGRVRRHVVPGPRGLPDAAAGRSSGCSATPAT